MKARALVMMAAAVLLAGTATAQTKAAPAAAEHDHHDHDAAAAAPAAGQISDAEYVERMLAGLSANLRTPTGVIRWKADFTWETVKKGTNRLVCFDRSGEDRRNPFAAQCTSLGSLERVAQNRKFRAASKTDAEEQALVTAAEKNGTRIKPEYGSPWININGPDHKTLRVHTTIAMPGATAASLGLPTDGKQTGAWVMDGGTSAAHIMLPGQ